MPRQSIWKGSSFDAFLLRMKKKRNLLLNRKLGSHLILFYRNSLIALYEFTMEKLLFVLRRNHEDPQIWNEDHLWRNTFIGYAVTGLITINRRLIQAIPTSLPPQPIGEAKKASNLQRIPPGVQGRSHFTYFLLGAVDKARFDTHHLEEYAQTSAALEKVTSALAQLEGELSRRSETSFAHLVNNSVATKMKHFPLEGVVIFPMKSRAYILNGNVKYELGKELLKELRRNTYWGRVEEDVVGHITKILEILDLIKIADVDPFQLRMKIFPLSLSGDARKWWMNEGDGKINTWEELVEQFLSKLYPLSYASNYDKMCDDDEEGRDPLEFIT
ncbi:hypothetical protein Tco_1401810 [Tanacetum coccineum]